MKNRHVHRLLALGIVFLLTFGGSCFDMGGETPCSPTDPSCGGSTPPPSSLPATASLPISLVRQRTDVWCWAATIEMVSRRYGINYDQCQYVSLVLNGYPCCAGPSGTGDPNCWIRGGSLQNMQQVLAQGSRLRSAYVGRPLTFDETVNEIGNGRPIIVSYRSGYQGHVVVFFGYNRAAGTVDIHDPILGTYRNVPFGNSFSYGGAFWQETLVGIAP